jgi:hypothetical protein
MFSLRSLGKYIKRDKKTNISSSDDKNASVDPRISVFTHGTIDFCSDAYAIHSFANVSRKKLEYGYLCPLEFYQSLNVRAYRMSINVL